MGKEKLKRYREVVQFENVIDFSGFRPGSEADQIGRWSDEVFENSNPITLELACGKGDYAIALAARYPDRNFIGIDIKGERLWVGAQQAIDQGLNNVCFIRGRIDHITQFFGKDEIAEIWITFPDPFLKNRRRNRRLTHPDFLNKYREVLREDGFINLKTDSPELYEFTNQVIEANQFEVRSRIDDVYALEETPELLQIKTYYERKHLEIGRTIRFVSFCIGQKVAK